MSSLPNAVHIDRVVRSLRDHPVKWMCRSDDGDYFDIEHVYQSTKDIAILNHGRDVWYATVDVAWRSATSMAATGADDSITALMAYEDSAHLLDSTPEEIRLLDALGHPYAILFLHTSIAFSNIAKKVL